MGAFLSELTWQEAKEAFQRTHTVLIPVGSTEQHGPHLPLGADWIEADAIAKAVTERADVITTDIVPVGISEHHMDFPGTLTITREHFKNYMMDICESLIHWGAERFIFINGHGGNVDALSEIALALRTKYAAVSAILQWWELVPSFNGQPTMQHAGYGEIALVAAAKPSLVKYEKVQLAPQKRVTENIIADLDHFTFKGGMIRTFLRTKDVSLIGSMKEQPEGGEEADLKSATPEVGHRLMKSLVNLIIEFLKEFNKVDFGPSK
ncbi:MAG: creatininase family protein [Candidatus Bathyarchaeia archaeon]